MDALLIEADIAPCFTYASYQNAIPVIRSIGISNPTAKNFERCTLELTSAPPFLRAKTWTIDRIIAGDLIPLSDRKADLDAAYLAGLNEAERGEITLRLSSGGAVQAERRIPVRLLARDEWGGAADMAQLLPAFVMPNDPAVASVLRTAADRLAAHGHPSGLDGYQTGNPQRAFLLTAAVYSAVAGMSLVYAEPPTSFESRGQKVRRPTTIAAEKLATCLDTSLLFASALEAAGLHPVILMFQGHAAIGVWLKNLENVQGDERDIILFSTTFSKDAAGKRTMDFGALNREGGQRRLNVAVTRARQEMIVFSGFTADQIDSGRTKSTGVHHLKTFLDFAARGAVALPAQNSGPAGDFESPFEEAVASELKQKGWTVVPQVSISGFRIDMGVRHPDLAGAYLAGVECDGASYHSSATARDRDKVREQVLRGLGWNIVRVWSTDWWFDPKGCAERLDASLAALLEQSRSKIAERPSPEAIVHWDMGHEIDPVEPLPEEPPDLVPEPLPPPFAERTELVVETPETTLAEQDSEETGNKPSVSEPASGLYRLTDLSAFKPDPARFHDFEYRGTLRSMIDAVIEQEGPLRADSLAQRIARAHGWLRTGGRIRERIDLHLRDIDTTAESSGDFIWKKGSIAELMDYRAPFDAGSRRTIADIPLAELAGVIVANGNLLDRPDPALGLARLLGVERLTVVSRSRLDEAVVRARVHLERGHRAE